MKLLKYMLVFVPISFIGYFLNFSPTIMFILACLSIIPLAGLMGEGTEEISFYAGPKIGGFLNGTFGNATELIISFFALKQGLFEVVKIIYCWSCHRKHLTCTGCEHVSRWFKI